MKKTEVIFIVWCILALASLFPIASLLNGSFPLFTLIWILVPLLAVARTKDASRVGVRQIAGGVFVQAAAINLLGLFVVTLLIEPWSHAYQMLVKAALASQPPDTTFAWLLRFERLPALSAMFLYSGFVSMFGEELFFRGWLLQLLQKRLNAPWAILIQALLFTILNLFVIVALPPLQSILYLIYTWLGVGIIGGWVAARTKSIWPSLFSVTVANLVFVALLV